MPEIEIRVESSTKNVFLYGSLFSSNSDTLFILFSGSGAQDRYESIASQKPFRILSEGLNKHDFDTFCWDDRGMGKSGGDYYSSGSSDIINDGKKIVEYFRKKYQYKKIILLGHSQGTLIASRIAVECAADTLILCAGIFRDGKTALLDQHKEICLSEQWSPDELESSLKEKETIFDILIDFELNESHKSIPKLEKILWNHFLNGSKKEDLTAKDHQILKEIVDDLCEWEWRFILTTNSFDILRQLSLPILFLFGEKDVQVNSKQEISFLKKAAFKNVTIKVIENHNHLFQDNSTGNLDEYSELEAPFSEKTISSITAWLEDLS
ncbi:MAG: alpha/beta fold hydrolase [Balneola sp.]